jgi:fused signal recognition particle receptor
MLLAIFMGILVLALVTGVGFVVARRRGGTATRTGAPPARPARPATATPTSSGGATAPPAVLAPAGRGLGDRIRALFRGGATDETWRSLEDALIRADVGPKGAADVVARVRQAYRAPADPAEVVSAQVASIFADDPRWTPPTAPRPPAVLMVVGVNGTGKTTTIGKISRLLAREGRSVALAASDTFRAAAGEQLDTWAQRSGAYLVAQGRGADPGAVAFDGYRAAEARGTDVLIIDTAGRLHTKTPLMEELKKVGRVVEKAAGRPPDEVLLVLDATTGQNGIAQARAFSEAVNITGVVLTKMDGSARGGIVLAVREELGVPIMLIGTGEGIDDIAPFDARSFARGLVA